MVEPYPGLAPAIEQLLGRPPSAQEIQQLAWLRHELQSWNERVNLTAIQDSEAIEIKHFLDSLSALPLMGDRSAVVDIGAGAGFPGIPLKLFQPDIRLTLVEATAKKVRFCQHVIDGLELAETVALHSRAEALGHQAAHRGQYDRAIARAVAPVAVLAEYMLPLLRSGGLMVAMKGAGGPAEADAAAPALALLGGQLDHIRAVALPTVDLPRHLIVIEKVSDTPREFPRRPGIPSKRPLADQSANG